MSATVYQARFAGPILIEKNKANSLALAIELDGAAATLTSGTLTVYRPAGGKLVDAVAGTVAAGTFTSATILAATTADESLGDRWICQFDIVIAGATETFYNDAALVVAPLRPPIGQTDLVERHSECANLLKSGITTGLQQYIEQAWADIMNRMYSDGVQFWKWRTASATRAVLLARTFEILFRDYSTLLDPDDRYSELSTMYGEDYEREYTQMRSRVDMLEDNTISGDNKPASAGIMLSSGPRRRWYDSSS